MLVDPKIRTIEEKTLVGLPIETTQSEDNPMRLWQRFKPLVKHIENQVPGIFYSVQILPKHVGFGEFTPQTKFQKWAAIEVTGAGKIPGTLSQLTLPAGEYAIFTHHGLASAFPKTLQYIFGMWMPKSIYEMDDRPQFEMMGPSYLGPSNPDSQEDIWIPVRKKN